MGESVVAPAGPAEVGAWSQHSLADPCGVVAGIVDHDGVDQRVLRRDVGQQGVGEVRLPVGGDDDDDRFFGHALLQCSTAG
jgi:hypothetical protein